MLTFISDWYDAIEKKRRCRRKTNRRNACVLFITFNVLCGILAMRRLFEISFTITEQGLIICSIAVWVLMLITTVYGFFTDIKDEI